MLVILAVILAGIQLVPGKTFTELVPGQEEEGKTWDRGIYTSSCLSELTGPNVENL